MIWANVKYTLRRLRRNKSFAFCLTLVIGLGVGSSAAILAVVYGVLLKPLRYPESGKLELIREVTTGLNTETFDSPANPKHFLAWRNECADCGPMAAVQTTSLALSGNGEPEEVTVSRVSANIFPEVLKVTPSLGRAFTQNEEQLGQDRVAILAYPFWSRRYHADPAVVGKQIMLEGLSYTVIGVLPRQFTFPSATQLGLHNGGTSPIQMFIPLALDWERYGMLGDNDFAVIVRVPPTHTAAQVKAGIDVIERRLAGQTGENVSFHSNFIPLQAAIAGGARKQLLLISGALVGLLLVLAANVANLLLAEAFSRSSELWIRRGLGASTAQLFSEMLCQYGTLISCGVLLGVPVGMIAVSLFRQLAPAALPRAEEIVVTPVFFLCILLAAVPLVLISILLPAWRLVSGAKMAESPAMGRAFTQNRQNSKTRQGFVALQVGLSTALIAVAALFTISLRNILHVEKGFQPENVVRATLVLPETKFKEVTLRNQFYEKILEKIKGLPGVRSAALTNVAPLEGEAWTDVVTPQGTSTRSGDAPLAYYRMVSPDYFSSLGIGLSEGRIFQPGEQSRGVVISMSAAKRYWANEDPIGRQFRRGDEKEPYYSVIGVARDVRGLKLDENPGPTIYIPYWLRGYSKAALRPVMVVHLQPGIKLDSVPLRAAIKAVDPDIPIAELRSMDSVVEDSVSGRRFQVVLLGAFALTALALAGFSLYGLASFYVQTRMREIGVRMALGASSKDIYALTLKQGVEPVAVGAGMGLLLAFIAATLERAALFGIRQYDPWVLLGSCLLTSLVAVIAYSVNARRAIAANPAASLAQQ
jgi:predicted permease